VRFQAVVAAICLTGCAQTVIYDNGRVVFKTQADVINFHYHTDTLDVRADSLNHSAATLAGGQAASQTITAVSNLAGTIGTTVVTLHTNSGVAAVVGAATVAGHAASIPKTEAVNKTLQIHHENENQRLMRYRATHMRLHPELRNCPCVE